MLIIMGAKNHCRVPKNECFYCCAVSAQFTDDTKYSYDYTNKLESIMDALVDAGMILDDNRFVVHNISATTNDISSQRGVLVLIDGFTAEYSETLSIPKGGEKMKSVKPVKPAAPKKGVVVKGAAVKKAPKGKC